MGGSLVLFLTGCEYFPHPAEEHFDEQEKPAGASSKPPGDPAKQLPLLGEALFQDESLSISGSQSCASCHVEGGAFTGNDDPDDPAFPVAMGADGVSRGERNVPTAMYESFSRPFEFTVQDGKVSAHGGLFWDGRADTLAAQAGGPILNPLEMALPDKAAAIERVEHGPSASLFRSVFGARVFGDVDAAYDDLCGAIAAYEETERFDPFTSKFDAVLAGKASFTDQEATGFALFKDQTKANCVGCHTVKVDSTNPQDWLFTGFAYRSIGVPRNREIPANADPAHYDLGLCAQPDLAARIPPEAGDPGHFIGGLCGAFRVPTLRNVAKTAPYMHNGYFRDLRSVVSFYATRETNPERWYPARPDGTVDRFDDLPEEYRTNVGVTRVPFDRRPGDSPHLSDAEIEAVVAFLGTLSDGYAAP